MAVVTTALGANSFRISYSVSDVNIAIIDALHNQIVASGWTSEDLSWWPSGSFTHCRVYSVLNVDGVTKKYVMLALQSNYLYVGALYSYSSSTKSFVNYATAPMSSFSSYTAVRLSIGNSAGGNVFLFIHSKWFYIHTSSASGTMGDSSQSGFIGVCETKLANPIEDSPATYPCYAYILPWTLMGANITTSTTGSAPYYNGSFDFYKSKANPSNPIMYSQGITPRGTWGWQQLMVDGNGAAYASNYCRLTNIISTYPNVWTGANLCFDIGVNLDVNTQSTFYFKGNFYGLKLLNGNIGSLGDIVQIKVNSDFMLDNSVETPTDFAILPVGAYRFAVPA